MNKISGYQDSNKRPMVLTLLCVLIFVSSIYRILVSIGTIMLIPADQNDLKAIFILSILSSILTFFGAVYLWKLKKIGLKIYLIGSAISFFYSLMKYNFFKSVFTANYESYVPETLKNLNFDLAFGVIVVLALAFAFYSQRKYLSN